MKLFHQLFPLFDHLYIYQLFEYDSWRFLKWFINNPFKRNLQQKNKLDFTLKSLILLFLSLLFAVIDGAYTSVLINNRLYLTPIFFLLFIQLSPVYLILSQLVFKPLESYQKNKIAAASKNKLKRLIDLKVIAITGSYAKTSTKDILYTLLWKDFRVVKTPKSFNTELSIARSILIDVKNNTEIFIAEMDAYQQGEIKQLSSIVRPDLAVITAIAPQHLERFGNDMTRLAKTQFEVLDNIKEGGKLFLNSTDKWSMSIASSIPKEHSNFRRYGFSNNNSNNNSHDNDVYTTNIKKTVGGISFTLHSNKGSLPITLPLFGEHHVINFLAAASIALELGLPLKTIQQRAKLLLQTPHRLEVKKQGKLTIIDNSYNTNPVSSRASLKLLKDLPGSQKILVTPGLIEQGKEHQKENEEFATAAAKIADEVIIVGENARKALLQGLLDAKFPKDKIHLVTTMNEGLQLFPTIAKDNSVILIENDLPDQYS